MKNIDLTGKASIPTGNDLASSLPAEVERGTRAKRLMKAQKRFLIVLQALVVVVAATLASSCNTTQSPRRQVDDARITAEIKSKLAQDVKPSSLINVKVDTTNGIVTLAGQVESEEVKARAARTAESVRGVLEVNNNLQIEPGPVSGVR